MLHSEEIKTPEEIQRNIKVTLSAMNQTMGQLQSEIRRKGDSIRHSFEHAKETLSVSGQARKNPWIVVGVAATAGFLASEVVLPRFFNGSKKKVIEMRSANETRSANEMRSAKGTGPNTRSGVPAYEAVVENETPSKEAANPQLNTFKSLAVGVVLGTLRDLVAGAIPKVGESFTRNLFDQTTKSLGGDPIRGRII
jgi:hypothetical protein